MEEASEQWGRATPHVIHGCLACKNHGPVLVPGNDATFGAQSQKRYGGVPACPRQTAPRLATCIPVTSTCLALPVCKCLQKEGREEKEREREREEKGEKREKKISYCESPTTASTRSAPTTGPGHTVAAVDGTVTSSSLQPLSICLGSRPTTAMTQRKHVSYDVVRHPPSPSSLSERLFFFHQPQLPRVFTRTRQSGGLVLVSGSTHPRYPGSVAFSSRRVQQTTACRIQSIPR